MAAYKYINGNNYYYPLKVIYFCHWRCCLFLDKKGRRKSSFLSKPLNLGYLSPEAVTVPGGTTLETNGYLAKTATNSPKNTPSVFENEGFSFDFDSLQYDGSDVTKL